MPVKSVAQGRYLGIHHPEVLRKFKDEGVSTSIKGLPFKLGKASPRGPLDRMFGGGK